MASETSFYYRNTFTEWASREGYQAFFQPTTVTLPTDVVLNEYGWLPAPTSAEIVIPMASIRPNESRTLYWVSEKIVTNSSNPVRMSLEGNFSFNEATGDFDPNGWKTIAGYTISNTHAHEWQGLMPIKTVGGESIRLRIFPSTGNNNDFYFKFIAIDLPFKD